MKRNLELSHPLGVIKIGSKIRFDFYSSTAKVVTLYLYAPQKPLPILIQPLKKLENCLFCLEIDAPPADYLYIYDVDGHKVLDPYAKALSTSNHFGEKSREVKCQFTFDHKFNWWGSKKPKLTKDELVIYELQLRSFTKHKSSNTEYPGTYLAVIEKIPYLKKLGVNAVELLPIHEFDETDNPRKDPKTGKKLLNVWGYMSYNFFCPTKKYASSNDRLSAIQDFKTMIKELHKNGIEVIMDVVYNHVGIASNLDLIDKGQYFLLNKDHTHTNFSGCGNTINANSEASSHLIIHSLRYFAEEFQIDGFRFDLAGCFVRNKDLVVLHNPPIFDLIANDPILKDIKIILEPWDAAGINLLHGFHIQNVSSWNYAFKVATRKFLRKDAFQEQFFKDSFLGSKYLFSQNSDPTYSVNYASCHDGFSLHDLVSYTHKNNLMNGENNRDGENDNMSSNCGIEGPTHSKEIEEKRDLLMRNFFFATLLSFGIPMIRMADEYGHTNYGNNNMYAQDELSWFLWNKEPKFCEFISKLIEIRKKLKIYKNQTYFHDDDIEIIELSHNKVVFVLLKEFLFCFNSSDAPYSMKKELSEKFDLIISSNPLAKRYLEQTVAANTFLLARSKHLLDF